MVRLSTLCQSKVAFVGLLVLVETLGRSASASEPTLEKSPASSSADGRVAAAQLLNLPLHLEPAPDGVGFVSRGPGYALRLDASASHFLLWGEAPASVRIELRGANERAESRAMDPLPGHSNYLLGNDPSRWRRAAPHYGSVEYRGVYPGIDVAYYGREGQLEYDHIVGSGADPGKIRLRFEGAKGLRIDGGGNVVVNVDGGGELVHRAPVAYQEGGTAASRCR